MDRLSQLQSLGIQPDPVNVSPRSRSSYSGWSGVTQTTSSTLSNLVPSSSARHPEAQALLSRPSIEMGDLSRHEVWWRDHYRPIKAAGYRLRPRYRPRWQPAWIQSGKSSCETEDGQHFQVRLSAQYPQSQLTASATSRD